MTLIAADQSFLLWAIMFAIAWSGFWTESTTWGQKLTGSTTVIAVGAILSNTGMIPFKTPTYGVINDYFVPLAIPVLLFQADIGRIVRESGPTLKGFLVGAVFTVAGTLSAFLLFDFGDQSGDLAGIFAATYIGGGVNFAGVGSALGFVDNNPDIYAAALAADNVISGLYLFVLALIPSVGFIAGKFKAHGKSTAQADAANESTKQLAMKPDATSISLTLALAFLFVFIGKGVENYFGWNGLDILTTTALTIAFATFLPGIAKRLAGNYQLGTVLIYVFFAALGAEIDIATMLAIAPILFVYAMLITLVHLGLILPAGRLLGLSLPETLTASNACVLGASTAAGLAAARGWHDLITPGILVGILGYAIGNFIGIGLAGLLG